ncbi:NAD(P)-dependent oxidoreductase [Paracoccaceae bacterium GXU_MW_L88]
MSLIVPFLGEDEEGWIDALNAAGDADVRPVAALDDAARAAAKVAILGGPAAENLDALPNLEWVQQLWAGVESNLPPTAARGIKLARMEDPQMAETMAQSVLIAALMLTRDVPHYTRAQRAKDWAQRPLVRPQDTRIGLLGLGALGMAAAEKLTAQGFPVAGWSRTPKALEGVETFHGEDGLGQLLAQSDILVILVPLTDGTRGLMNAARLAKLPKGAALVNFARGPIVEEAALLAALDAGHLSEAILDVFAKEPLPPENPLWTAPRVTIWPHISAPTHLGTASKIAMDRIARWQETGALPPIVDPVRGY